MRIKGTRWCIAMLVTLGALGACGGGDEDDDDDDGGDDDVTVDECSDGTADCVDGASCTDLPDGFACECPAGYEGDGTDSGDGCTNVDECATGTDDCVEGASCTDTDGSFTCACPAGYDGDGHEAGTGCPDFDECTAETDNCLADLGACTNVPGSFTCACVGGYSGDGVTSCVDIDECDLADACDAFSTCVNSVGAYDCMGLYGGSQFNVHIYRLDPDTFQPLATIDPVVEGGVVTGVASLAFDPTNGDVYAVLKRAGVGIPVRQRELARFEPLTASYTVVGVLGGQFSTIAFREDGQLFGITGDAIEVGQWPTVPLPRETLYTIDKATGSIAVAATLGNGGNGEVLQYNPDDNAFYHWSGRVAGIFERIGSVAPYTVTAIAPNGGNEVLGAWWDDLANNFAVFERTSTGSGTGVMRRFTTAAPAATVEANLPTVMRTPVTSPTFEHEIQPKTGPAAGGATVILHSQGFDALGTETVTLNWGGINVTATVLDDERLQVTTPVHASGTVDVSYVNPGGGADTRVYFNWPGSYTFQ